MAQCWGGQVEQLFSPVYKLEVSSEHLPQLLSTLAFEIGLLSGLELSDPARMSSQEVSGILLSLLPSAGVKGFT